MLKSKTLIVAATFLGLHSMLPDNSYAWPRIFRPRSCRCQESVPPASRTAKPRGPNVHAELENVAACFHSAVSILQAEPATPVEVGAFMHKAKSAVVASRRPSTDANFGALHWNATRTSLVTTVGQPIHCRVLGESHDNYGPQGAAWFTEYEFYVPGTDYRSRITIQLTVD